MFLDIVNYLNKYNLRLSELGNSWREIIKKTVPFIWDPEPTEAFDVIKNEMTSMPILRYYDHSKPLPLQTNVSLKGLDAVLLQERHPVYFASKSLHVHQKNLILQLTLSLLLLDGIWIGFATFNLAKHLSLKQTKSHLKCMFQVFDTSHTKPLVLFNKNPTTCIYCQVY